MAIQKILDHLGLSTPEAAKPPPPAGELLRVAEHGDGWGVQLLWVRTFETVEELRLALHAWLKAYSERWLIERQAIALRRKSVVTCLPRRWPHE